jgi:TRAP-type mannitol/chloroaromatic compound transport system substrate-binding protein
MNFFLNYRGLTVSKLSPEMIEEIKRIGNEELDNFARKDAFFAKVLASQRSYRKLVEPYAELVRLPYPYAK